jgi:hypothetical protein
MNNVHKFMEFHREKEACGWFIVSFVCFCKIPRCIHYSRRRIN